MKAFRIALCVGMAAAFGVVGIAQAAPVTPAAALALASAGAAVETVQFMPGSGFPYPHERGAIVDWCAVWAQGCGWPGANQFCQARGFSHAVGWNIFRPGHTFVLGSDRYCDGGGCKGFRFVRCG